MTKDNPVSSDNTDKIYCRKIMRGLLQENHKIRYIIKEIHLSAMGHVDISRFTDMVQMMVIHVQNVVK